MFPIQEWCWSIFSPAPKVGRERKNEATPFFHSLPFLIGSERHRKHGVIAAPGQVLRSWSNGSIRQAGSVSKFLDFSCGKTVALRELRS
jgi:hypothetical protein